MNLDDKICYCYHVTLRKLVNFARRERPERPSQMSLCLGAGTGCGWCIPILKKIHAQAMSDGPPPASGIPGLPDSVTDYADARRTYLTSDQKHTF